MLFDSHAHYDDERFDTDRNETIESAMKSGVTRILNAASGLNSSRTSLELAGRYEGVYASVGVHPQSTGNMDESIMNEIERLASHDKVLAIGETGLDYYYEYSSRDTQKYWFIRQIELARKLKLPVIIHDRDAHEDTLNIVKDHNAGDVGGVFHCYTGSVEMLGSVLDNNFCISVGGAVTFKNAKKLPEVVRFVPPDMLLIETDSPYMSPEPFRGKRNDSSKVRFVAEKIAEIRGISFDRVAEITYANACRLFNIT